MNHAKKRANEREIKPDTLSFVHSPIESIGNKVGNDRCFDVIISNGAFCLLPDKSLGFAESYRLLKPGGRIAICTTVIQDTLKQDVEWPLCMQTFARLDELEPMLQDLGFKDIHIDLSDSLMEIESPDSTNEEGEETWD